MAIGLLDGRALLAACTLYVHRNNDRHFLYVCETADFPFQSFDKSAWRLLARGVDAPPAGRRALKRASYYEVWRRGEAETAGG